MYFPVDSQDNAEYDDRELVTVLHVMETIMDRGGFDHVLWCGDFNYDPRRNTRFTETIRNFLQRINLSSVW